MAEIARAIKPRILIVSSSRADVGILTPVWTSLVERGRVETHLLLTGMHITNDDFVRSHLHEDLSVHKCGTDILGATPDVAATSISDIARECVEVLIRVSPDIILLTGDRLDMFPVAFASMPLNIPLAHLHGGELTLGAIDERIRHAMTKLSHIHFTSTSEAAARVCSMGEEAWRIQVTGAPGLDSLRSTEVMSRDALFETLGFEGSNDCALRLVGVHPETNNVQPVAPMYAVLTALDELPPAPTFFTAPNADPGGMRMREEIQKFVNDRPWARYEDTLGSLRYANAMRHASLMIGNSSSGIIEAPMFSLPVVNVGDRQAGRSRAANVIDCPNEANVVREAIAKIVSTKRPDFESGKSPYGDGNASQRIARALEQLPSAEKLLLKKFWVGGAEFDAPWDDTPWKG